MIILNMTAETEPHWDQASGTTHTIDLKVNGQTIATIDAGFMMYPDDQEEVSHRVAGWLRERLAR